MKLCLQFNRPDLYENTITASPHLCLCVLVLCTVYADKMVLEVWLHLFSSFVLVLGRKAHLFLFPVILN